MKLFLGKLSELLKYGHGDGYGYGDSYGSGYGYGYGDGYGYGYGYGYGSGYGEDMAKAGVTEIKERCKNE